MTKAITRRKFMATSAAAGAGLATARIAPAAEWKTKLSKALITGKIEEKSLMTMKEAGFEGVECGAWDVDRADAEKARAVADKCGMKIHSVLRGWLDFNDPAKIENDILSIERALQAAAGYGADAILVVPCKTGGMPMPQPWEFDIEFDEKTAEVSRVAKGDADYSKYIEAQNLATKVSREALRRLIPAAEKAKVILAVENVWNNLWVKPDLTAAFMKSIDSEWIQYYFDIGNHVRYALPEEWIRALGKMIVKIHIKDFKLNSNGQGGNWADIRDGSVDWPLVRRELDRVGYNDFMTIEGSGKLSMDERNKRLTQIIAGE